MAYLQDAGVNITEVKQCTSTLYRLKSYYDEALLNVKNRTGKEDTGFEFFYEMEHIFSENSAYNLKSVVDTS